MSVKIMKFRVLFWEQCLGLGRNDFYFEIYPSSFVFIHNTPVCPLVMYLIIWPLHKEYDKIEVKKDDE